MIEQFYLTDRLGSNRFYLYGQSGPESNRNDLVFHIPQTPRVEPHHSVIFRTRFQVLQTNTNNSFSYY